MVDSINVLRGAAKGAQEERANRERKVSLPHEVMRGDERSRAPIVACAGMANRQVSGMHTWLSRWHLKAKFLGASRSCTWCTATRPSMEPRQKPCWSGKHATQRDWYLSGEVIVE